MAYQTPSRAKQSSTTTGTGALTLIPGDASLQTFQSAFGNGPVKVGYVISRDGSFFEIGVGTFTAPNTLTRDTVDRSSSGNALVNIPTGTTDVFARWPGASSASDVFSAGKTQSLDDWGNSQIFKGSSAANYSLLALTAVPQPFEQLLANEGTAILSVVPNGTDKINGTNATVTLAAGEWAWLTPSGDSAIGWVLARGAWADAARTGTANNFAQDQTITSTTVGAAAGPSMILDRNIAGAANNQIGAVDFRGRDSGGTNVIDFAKIITQIINATAGALASIMSFQTMVANALATRFSIGAGLFSANATTGDMGADTVNVKVYYRDGVALPDQRTFTSSDLTISAAGGSAIAHGLGSIPTSVEIFLVCVTGEHNYTAGMIVPFKVNSDADGTGSPTGVAIALDTTNITYRFSSVAAVLQLLDLTTGNAFSPTLANWKLRIRVRV